MAVRIGGLEFAPRLIPTLVFLLVWPGLLALGFWQLDRAEQKHDIEREREQRRVLGPLDLAAGPLDVQRDRYHSAIARGAKSRPKPG